jgi:hypothetical protein
MTNLRDYPSICLERPRKTMKNLSPNISRELNPERPEYKTGMLTTQMFVMFGNQTIIKHSHKCLNNESWQLNCLLNTSVLLHIIKTYQFDT